MNGGANDNRLLILLYHGVTEDASSGIENASRKHIDAAEFSRQMSFLRGHANVLSMDDVVDLHDAGAPYPERAVCVSFDDGFLNNYTVAKPILEAAEIPAAFYVSTGLIGTRGMFWVDQLEDCINRTVHTTISVRLEGARELTLTSDAEKIAALEAIKRYCKASPAGEKDRVLAEVDAATGVRPCADAAANYRTMTWDHVREIADHPLFTVGGHGVMHDILTRLSEDDCEREIRQSLATLRSQLGRDVRHYSYPEGQSDHYDERIVALLAQEGVRCSPSARAMINDRNIGLFDLGRIMVGFRGEPFPHAFFVS
ncbi:MAG TPA: polysaccharide deacetylase family protein [Thermoanaerobaculia bacterium]|nr:polysaccharide deacetylase family protein [Thermoanaerobaculia bacterium]